MDADGRRPYRAYRHYARVRAMRVVRRIIMAKPLRLGARDLKRVDCPAGWMSPDGYARYLRKTLAALRGRRMER